MTAINSQPVLASKNLQQILAYSRQLSADLIVLEPQLGNNNHKTGNWQLSFRTANNDNCFVVPNKLADTLLAEIKTRAGINNKRREGQITINNQTNAGHYQVTALSTAAGPKIVLQALEQNQEPRLLDQLGLEPENLDLFKQVITGGKGLVIFCGPAASGKTTSIYSLLQTIKSPRLNITTIEDQPKQHLDDINQIHRHYKVNVNQLLRSLTAADLDILYLNTVEPDLDWSLLANLASSKLVLIKMQADNTASALANLASQPNFDPQIWSRLKLLIHQRLAKQNCPNCLVGGKLDYYTLDDLHNQFELDDTRTLRQLDFYRGAGCPACNHSGYQDQLALFELLAPTTDLQIALEQQQAEKIQEAINEALATSLFEDAFTKALQGRLCVSEIQKLF